MTSVLTNHALDNPGETLDAHTMANLWKALEEGAVSVEERREIGKRLRANNLTIATYLARERMARREARGMVAELLETGDFAEWHERDHLEGSFEVCHGCRLVVPPHKDDCPVERARRAVKAWEEKANG